MRKASAGLALFILVVFCGCSAANENDNIVPVESEIIIGSEISNAGSLRVELNKGMVISLPSDIDEVSSMILQGDTIYMISRYLYPLTESSIKKLVSYNIDSGTTAYYNLVLPLETEILHLATDGESLWMLCCQPREKKAWIQKTDNCGNELSSQSIDFENIELRFDDIYNLSGFTVDDFENVYISAENTVLIYGKNGLMNEAITETNISRMAYCNSGIFAFTEDEIETGLTLYTDAASISFLSYDYVNVFMDENDSFGWNENGIYSFDGFDQSLIVNWADVGLGSSLYSGVFYDDYFLFLRADSKGKFNLYKVYNETDSGPEKKVITIAVTVSPWAGYLNDIIEDFNLYNQDYKIEILDYSMEDDPITKLGLDLSSGNVPDMYYLEGMPYASYAESGMLVDMLTLMDGDSTIAPEDFVPGFLSAMEYNGGLYRISPIAMVCTMVGSSEVFGDSADISLGEFFDIWESFSTANPSAILGWGPSQMMFELMLYSSLDKHFIDWKNGTCSFSSDDFIKLMEYAKEAEEDYTAFNRDGRLEQVNDGSAMVCVYTYSTFEGFTAIKNVMTNGYSLLGFLPPSATCNINCPIGISSASDSTDGAWEFIKYMLSDDFQNNLASGFPVKLSAFESSFNKISEDIMYTDDEGNEAAMKRVMEINRSGREVETLSKNDYEQILSHINAISSAFFTDESIVYMIMEEAAAYFNGEKTAEEAARIIQSRMSIYVSERS